MFTVQLLRGPSWEQPTEVIDCRECQTDSVASATAEARFWLQQSQTIEPHRGATHYRILDAQSQAVLGGPP